MMTFENGLQSELADLNATEAFASGLAKALIPGVVIYLHGTLGAGKTTLVRAIIAALGYKGLIKSPTFTLVEEYKLDELEISHFDLYRLADPAELEFIGIRDYVARGDVNIFEWPDLGRGYIPPADLEITLELIGDPPGAVHSRKVTLIANTDLGRKVLKAFLVGS